MRKLVEMLRVPGRTCRSTVLAFSMHSAHEVVIPARCWPHPNLAAGKPLLKRVALLPSEESD